MKPEISALESFHSSEIVTVVMPTRARPWYFTAIFDFLPLETLLITPDLLADYFYSDTFSLPDTGNRPLYCGRVASRYVHLVIARNYLSKQ